MYRVYNPEKLRALVESDDISAPELARRVAVASRRKVHRATVDRHLKGETTPTVEILIAYADLFQVPLDFFCDRI